MRPIFPLLVALCVPWAASGAEVQGVRTWPAPDNTRIVFDISEPVEYRLFGLDNPPRLVVDLQHTALAKAGLPQPSEKDRFMRHMRSAARDGGDLRVVLDLQGRSRFRSFLLKPNRQYGHRLVIDLYHDEGTAAPPVKRAVDTPQGLRDIVIAIDAGHGGDDPGAVGYRGTYEKDVVLEIARELGGLIEQERGMRPFLVRDGDYFISLRKRTVLARQEKADLFVSIHADAFEDSRVNGMSLYVLSSNGASDEAARWLAEKENASDLVGGVSLEDKDDLLRSVLLDLSQSATIEASYAAGDAMLRHIRPVARLHKHSVQQAAFAVLKSPDVPSVLVETAFISNPDDERRLRNRRSQREIARGILSGIRSYFSNHPPAGTLFAARRHTIARGDTLSDIARHYRVSIDQLKALNALQTDRLRVGQVLRIPAGSEG